MQTGQTNKTTENKNQQRPSGKQTPAEGNDKNVLNKQKQDDPVNPKDNYFGDKKNDGDKKDSKRDDKKNKSDKSEGSLYKEELPGQDDDSGKTIKQTPKM